MVIFVVVALAVVTVSLLNIILVAAVLFVLAVGFDVDIVVGGMGLVHDQDELIRFGRCFKMSSSSRLKG